MNTTMFMPGSYERDEYVESFVAITMQYVSNFEVLSWKGSVVTYATCGKNWHIRFVTNFIFCLQGGPKSKRLQNYQNIVLKPANEIRFIRQIKVLYQYSTKILCWYQIFCTWPTF